MRHTFNQTPFLQKGQALVIVILVMTIALTIGLSVATRSILNVRISTEEQDSQRAFSAAEAGIEQALTSSSSGTFAGPKLSNNAEIKTISIGQLIGDQILINNGNTINRDDGVDIWLVDHNDQGDPIYSTSRNGTLSLFWGNSSDYCSNTTSTNTMAALEVVVVHGSTTSPQTSHYAFDPCANRRSSNKFSNTTSFTGDFLGRKFKYQVNIAVNSGLFVRIIPLYADTVVGAGGSFSLPLQGKIIEAVGVSGKTERKITTFKGYSKLPTEFFPHMVFSP